MEDRLLSGQTATVFLGKPKKKQKKFPESIPERNKALT